jgi:hypothetical protein
LRERANGRSPLSLSLFLKVVTHLKRGASDRQSTAPPAAHPGSRTPPRHPGTRRPRFSPPTVHKVPVPLSGPQSTCPSIEPIPLSRETARKGGNQTARPRTLRPRPRADGPQHSSRAPGRSTKYLSLYPKKENGDVAEGWSDGLVSGFGAVERSTKYLSLYRSRPSNAPPASRRDDRSEPWVAVPPGPQAPPTDGHPRGPPAPLKIAPRRRARATPSPWARRVQYTKYLSLYRPPSFILHPSSFILHPSSFILFPIPEGWPIIAVGGRPRPGRRPHSPTATHGSQRPKNRTPEGCQNLPIRLRPAV